LRVELVPLGRERGEDLPLLRRELDGAAAGAPPLAGGLQLAARALEPGRRAQARERVGQLA